MADRPPNAAKVCVAGRSHEWRKGRCVRCGAEQPRHRDAVAAAVTDEPQGPFPTVAALLAILPDPQKPGEWDPPTAEVLEKRAEIAQGRLPDHQETAERARRYCGPLWARLDEWRLQHRPQVPFVSPIFAAALADHLAETHETQESWFVKSKARMARMLTISADEVLQGEREYFRLAETGYRLLYRARSLLTALRELVEDWYDDDPMPEGGVRIYRLLTIALHDLDAVDVKLRDQYDLRVWNDDERDAVKQIEEQLTRRLRNHAEWEQANRRNERLLSRQASRAATAEAADTLCVTCRKRQRHFGEYCKRCCPPDERPTGKVT